jgi:hypothetical protein
LVENTSGGPIMVTVEVEKTNMAEDIGGQRVEGVDVRSPPPLTQCLVCWVATRRARRCPSFG